MRKAFAIFFLPVLGLAAAWAAAPFDHGTWDQLLQRHVVVVDRGSVTRVDYAGMAQEREALRGYLSSLSNVSPVTFDSWGREHQLAFLINAYNAWTVELVLEKFPALDSIKELGSIFQSPWQKRFVPLLGETRSLDDIEHSLIRGSERFNEPRIHFAVNCASIGCPALRAEAYTGDRLEPQLEGATRSFLQDRGRNRLQGDKLQVSSLFDWYRGDFEQGWRGQKKLTEFLAAYYEALGLSQAQRELLVRGELEVEFLDYDWGLNGEP